MFSEAVSRRRSTQALDDSDVQWNSATSFALLGFAVAIIWMVFDFFYFHWVLVPGVLSAAVAMYFVSTKLGEWFLRSAAAKDLFSAAAVGASIALFTLLVGIVALGVTNFVVGSVDELFNLSLGMGYSSVADGVISYIYKPVLAVILFGSLPAVILGVVFGILSYASWKEKEVV